MRDSVLMVICDYMRDSVLMVKSDYMRDSFMMSKVIYMRDSFMMSKVKVTGVNMRNGNVRESSLSGLESRTFHSDYFLPLHLRKQMALNNMLNHIGLHLNI